MSCLVNLYKKFGRFGLCVDVVLVNLVLAAVVRLALMVWAWEKIPHEMTRFGAILTHGFIYDLFFGIYMALPAAILLALLPSGWLQKRLLRGIQAISVFIFCSVMIFGAVSEFLFWEEFSVRFNFIAVDYLVYTTEVVENIWQSYPMGWILSALFLVSGGLTYGYQKLTVKRSDEFSFKRRGAFAGFLLIGSILGILVLGQSFREFDENNYVNELGSNGPYQFFAAFRNNTLDYEQFYLQGDDEKLSAKLHEIYRKPVSAVEQNNLYTIGREVNNGPEQHKNVILVTVESLSSKYVTEELAPFLTRLQNEALYFDNFYATGTRTVRGLEALTLSYPPTPGRSIVKRPDQQPLHSLGEVFEKRGYDTAFMYGGRGYFDNMNAFFSANGYRIVDQGDLSDAEVSFANAWGVCDGDLYRRTLKEADQSVAAGKPFFYHLMTTSNHRPYTIPEVPYQYEGSRRGRVVRYSDYALEEFLKSASEKAWFKDTVFVIVADHCASSAGKEALNVAKYHIPLWIYAPGFVAPQRVQKMCSQIDLAPTLLGLLGGRYESYFFGQDVLKADFQPRALIGNYQKLGLLKDDRLGILLPGKKSLLLEQVFEEEPVSSDERIPVDFMEELQAYYQSADYIWKHQLHVIKEEVSQ